MILGCLKYEILRPYPRPQDDNPLSSRTSGVVLVCHPDGVLFAGRISALNLDCLRGEILHFVQDDNQTPVVPNERSDREASPEGKDLDFAFACRPERTK